MSINKKKLYKLISQEKFYLNDDIGDVDSLYNEFTLKLKFVSKVVSWVYNSSTFLLMT